MLTLCSRYSYIFFSKQNYMWMNEYTCTIVQCGAELDTTQFNCVRAWMFGTCIQEIFSQFVYVAQQSYSRGAWITRTLIMIHIGLLKQTLLVSPKQTQHASDNFFMYNSSDIFSIVLYHRCLDVKGKIATNYYQQSDCILEYFILLLTM